MDEYHFTVLTDRTGFTLYLPNGMRLMARGNILLDRHYRKYLLDHQDQNIYDILDQMVAKYNIQGEEVGLMEADHDGFKLIKGNVHYRIDSIGMLLQRLVDSYCFK